MTTRKKRWIFNERLFIPDYQLVDKKTQESAMPMKRKRTANGPTFDMVDRPKRPKVKMSDQPTVPDAYILWETAEPAKKTRRQLEDLIEVARDEIRRLCSENDRLRLIIRGLDRGAKRRATRLK